MKKVLTSASAGIGGTDGLLGVEQGDIEEDKSFDQGEAGPPNLDAATEEYKEEQAFRRWVVAQVCSIEHRLVGERLQ